MDASSESSVISGFLGSGQPIRGERIPPSFEGRVVQIVAARANNETVC